IGSHISTVFNLVDELSRTPTPDPIEQCLKANSPTRLREEAVLISRIGKEYGIEDTAAPIRDKDSNVLGCVLVFHDVTYQREMAREMNYRATHDALTGAVNRNEFENRLKQAISSSNKPETTHSLLYIDLDRFKIVNDTSGHAAGDALLEK